MLQERVEKVKRLMASALAKPPAEREAYLDAACAGDVYLRQDVELYLNSGEKTEQFNYQVDNDAQTESSVEIPPHLLTESQGSTPSDGDDALQVMKSWTPDLVITDLRMPNMDGVELCRHLRAKSGIPIIVLSVRNEERTKVEALDSDGDGVKNIDEIKNGTNPGDPASK